MALFGEIAARQMKNAPSMPRRGIIDIGSNSVRLVVYQGHPRIPAILFNEKVMAGLGRELGTTGAISDQSIVLAKTALARFATIARAMELEDTRTVATAAVRDASNGNAIIECCNQLGLSVEILSGEDEARAAGYGVLSAIPDADGIVGDLGGGSLELVRVKGGCIEHSASFPLGVLRIGAMREKRGKVLDRHVATMLHDAGWSGQGKALPLYLVGGSWRALARLDMNLNHYPLPIIHHYAMTPATIDRLGRTIAHLSKARIKGVGGLSSLRASTLGDATALLSILLRQLGCNATIASAFGLREGLLFASLGDDDKSLDPLIIAAREEGRALGRFSEHGDLLNRWIAPLFAQEPPEHARLRHAACLLADVAWRANPEFRAERGVEAALHGNWVSIDASERAMLAQALHASLGGSGIAGDPVAQLADRDLLERATVWGLAIRLGQRLSGGLALPLKLTTVSLEAGNLIVGLTKGNEALYGDSVERRHNALAAVLGHKPEVRASG